MHSLRSAAALLSGADSPDRLQELVASVGFDSPLLPLDRATRETLGIPDLYDDVRIGRGAGTLRVLLVSAPPAPPIREHLIRLATRLSSAAPHFLWLLVVASGHGPHLGFATWSAERRPPRVAALAVDRTRVVDSDAETLCALAAAQNSVDVLTHARWLEILGRDALTRRFYRTLERLVGELGISLSGGASPDDRRELALLCASRLIFLSFLEAKGWLAGDRGFLARSFSECMATGGAYHARVLLPLFFGTLNTPLRARAAAARHFGAIPFLNGGLFAPTAVERRHRRARFPDATVGALFGDLLTRYRFTAREETTSWSDAAIDPEMLGRAFESLMASRERRVSGAYYTPQALVDDVTGAALEHAFRGCAAPEAVARLLRGEPIAPDDRAPIASRLDQLRVLDPACGSGAFLVHVLERLAAIHAAVGDTRPPDAIRRDVLSRSIFGVDVNPMAVWLCELRLWLSIVIEGEETDPSRVPPLPNLDHNVSVGDSLAGGDFSTVARAGAGDRIAILRRRYARATGRRKQALADALDSEERHHALAALDAALERLTAARRGLLAVLRGRDLFGERNAPDAAQRAHLEASRRRAKELRTQRRRLADGGALPFSFASRFADVAQAGGFGIIVGNPPWVRLHRIPRDSREAFRRDFAVFRTPGWERGIRLTRSGTAFGSQVDLAALFVERSLFLVAPRGVLALLVPAKLWRSLAGGSVRRLLHEHAAVLALDDWSESRSAFDAAVYPSLLVAEPKCVRPSESLGQGAPRGGPWRAAESLGPRASRPLSSPNRPRRKARVPSTGVLSASLHQRDRVLRWDIESAALGFDDCPGSPWLLVPPPVRHAFDRLRRDSVPLAESILGRPHLGVKCGRNEAFLVRCLDDDAPLARITGMTGRTGAVERSMLRPVLRGERVTPWRLAPDDERILWTHDTAGAPLDALPTGAAAWLAPWRRRLQGRSDHRGLGRWWSLFRTDGASSVTPRVVWADIGRTPRAAVLLAGDETIPLNTCYVARCQTVADAHVLAAILNSPLAAAWLHVLAEPARGGYHRYLGWTMALLPVPREWDRARERLAPVGERAFHGEVTSPHALLDVVLEAYDVRVRDMAPLLAWSAR